MDYSGIRVARDILELEGISIPTDEAAIRVAAFEAYVRRQDFIAAHSVRLAKDWRSFTKEDWVEIIQISGKEWIRANIGALMACKYHGLI